MILKLILDSFDESVNHYQKAIWTMLANCKMISVSRLDSNVESY
jgi:hypothetical protein